MSLLLFESFVEGKLKREPLVSLEAKVKSPSPKPAEPKAKKSRVSEEQQDAAAPKARKPRSRKPSAKGAAKRKEEQKGQTSEKSTPKRGAKPAKSAKPARKTVSKAAKKKELDEVGHCAACASESRPKAYVKKQLHSARCSVLFVAFFCLVFGHCQAYSKGWVAGKKSFPGEPQKWAEEGRATRAARFKALQQEGKC